MLFEMDGIEVPISIDAALHEQFAQAFAPEKTAELDVDEMTARAPNAPEDDKRFYLQMASGKNKIEWKFGRDQAEQLHRTLGVWLKEFPPRKSH